MAEKPPKDSVNARLIQACGKHLKAIAALEKAYATISKVYEEGRAGEEAMEKLRLVEVGCLGSIHSLAD